MKKPFIKSPTILSSISFLLIGEILIYTLLEKSFFSFDFDRDYFAYVVFADFLLFFVYSFYLLSKKILIKDDFFKLILPFLLNMGFILFSYFSLSFPISQIVLILTFFTQLFLFLDIENKKIGSLKNLFSFFAIFLFFFSVYNFFYNSYFPYWFFIILINLFLSMMLYYELSFFEIARKNLYLSIIIFAVLISEFFLFLFFIPVSSFLIKSLFLILIYYLYLALIQSYISKKISFKEALKNFIVFACLLIIVILYLYFRSN